MVRKIYVCIALPLLLFASPDAWKFCGPVFPVVVEFIEKMIATNGKVSVIALDLNTVSSPSAKEKPGLETTDFGVASNSFFTVWFLTMSSDNVARFAWPVVPQNSPSLARVFGPIFQTTDLRREDRSRRSIRSCHP